MGERCVRNAEAEGSTPFRSTIFSSRWKITGSFTVKHVRNISAMPAPAFLEVQPNLLLRFLDVVFQQVVIKKIQEKNAAS